MGWEDPLEKGMATHSRILAWRIPWTKEPGSYSPQGRTESDTTEATLHIHITYLQGRASRLSVQLASTT